MGILGINLTFQSFELEEFNIMFIGAPGQMFSMLNNVMKYRVGKYLAVLLLLIVVNAVPGAV